LYRKTTFTNNGYQVRHLAFAAAIGNKGMLSYNLESRFMIHPVLTLLKVLQERVFEAKKVISGLQQQVEYMATELIKFEESCKRK